MKMKLSLLFIVMDVLTLLVYPFVFAHGKLQQFAKPKKGDALVVVPVEQGR